MKIHSRILRLTLSLIMALCLIPAIALAAEITVENGESLQAAIDSANDGDVIKLISNVDLSSSELTIPVGTSVTIELNGKQLSGKTNKTGTYSLITNKGTLTIQDSTDTRKDGTGTGLITVEIENPDKAVSPSYASNLITNHGTLTVKSGKLENTGKGYACYAIDNQTNSNLYTPVLNIDGGRMVQNYSCTYAVRMFCNSESSFNTVNISGGVIEGGYGLWVQDPNEKANKARLNITGGVINANDGFALFVGGTSRDYSNMILSISGGTINGTGAAIRGAKNINAGFSEISVTGGEFRAFQAGSNIGGFISGGKFKSKPDEGLLADGYKIVGNDTDGYSTDVIVKIARIDSTFYPSLQAAINAAKNGDVIRLIGGDEDGEIHEAVTVGEGKEITIDLNGREIYSEDSIEITNKGKLILADSSADQSGWVWEVLNSGKMSISGGFVHKLNTAINCETVVNGGGIYMQTENSQGNMKIQSGNFSFDPSDYTDENAVVARFQMQRSFGDHYIETSDWYAVNESIAELADSMERVDSAAPGTAKFTICKAPQNGSQLYIRGFHKDILIYNNTDSKIILNGRIIGAGVQGETLANLPLAYNGSIPSTGDNSAVALWFVMAALAVCGLSILNVRRKANAR